jgi:peptidoglycan/LPS O-acetylase OafA/YrhL
VIGDLFAALAFKSFVGGAGVDATSILGPALEPRLLVYLGKISYGIYLYHILAPGVIGWSFRALGQLSPPGFLAEHPSRNNPAPSIYVAMLFSNILVAIAMASVPWGCWNDRWQSSENESDNWARWLRQLC